MLDIPEPVKSYWDKELGLEFSSVKLGPDGEVESFNMKSRGDHGNKLATKIVLRMLSEAVPMTSKKQ